MNEFKGRSSPITGLEQLNWGSRAQFLGMPEEEWTYRDAPVVVLPVPYEATVSYMPGTGRGPGAILEASRYVELYDHELDTEPYLVGIHTLPELLLSGAGPAQALRELEQVCAQLADDGKFAILLGGEHTISAVPILTHAKRLGPDRRLTVLQLDAHADLRREYDGTDYSHACVMHRVHREVDLVPVGVRSLTAEEGQLIRSAGIPVVFGHELEEEGWIERVMSFLGENVYLTLDLDYFDPSLLPATGTPEPGGGLWYPTLELLERVFRERRVVGCDLVELAPIPGIVAPDFLAAKLVYKLVAFHRRGTG